MSILSYVLIGTQVLTFLLAIISTIVAKFKGKDFKFTNDELQKINELVSKVVPDVIKNIENIYPNAPSEVKKSAAMDKLNLYTLKNGLSVTEDYLSSMIEDFVALTKSVNVPRETNNETQIPNTYGGGYGIK